MWWNRYTNRFYKWRLIPSLSCYSDLWELRHSSTFNTIFVWCYSLLYDKNEVWTQWTYKHVSDYSRKRWRVCPTSSFKKLNNRMLRAKCLKPFVLLRRVCNTSFLCVCVQKFAFQTGSYVGSSAPVTVYHVVPFSSLQKGSGAILNTVKTKANPAMKTVYKFVSVIELHRRCTYIGEGWGCF